MDALGSDRNPGEVRRLEEAKELLSRAQKVCVLSGAGVSAESGVPTFRGEGGSMDDGPDYVIYGLETDTFY